MKEEQSVSESEKIDKIISDLKFLQDKAEYAMVKIAYGMAITICEIHKKGEDNDTR